MAALNAALEKRLGEAWQLRAGAKYTYNDMHNEALYRYLRPEGWETLDAYSYVTDYTEHITAAYAAATLKKGHWNVVAGLRGEYTRTTGYGSDVRQRYFSLFPNANLTYGVDFDLGDLCTYRYADVGIETTKRITEIQEVYEGSKQTLSVVFGNDQMTSITKIIQREVF